MRPLRYLLLALVAGPLLAADFARFLVCGECRRPNHKTPQSFFQAALLFI